MQELDDNIIRFYDVADGKVVSSLILYWVRLPSRYLGVIEEVKTEPKYRNQGRATKLITLALDKARELGLSCVELTVREDNEGAQHLYRNFGFFDRSNRAYRVNL